MKAGRNDPCPCGSGKKYKKCCLEKDELEDNRELAVKNEPPRRQEIIDEWEHEEEDIFEDDEDIDDEASQESDESQNDDIPDEEGDPDDEDELPELSEEDDMLIEIWWEDYKKMNNTVAEREHLVAFMERYPHLVDYLELEHEVLFELGADHFTEGIYETFVELLLRIRKEYPDTYRKSFGWYDYDIICWSMAQGFPENINQYFDFFKQDEDREYVFKLEDLIVFLRATNHSDILLTGLEKSKYSGYLLEIIVNDTISRYLDRPVSDESVSSLMNELLSNGVKVDLQSDAEFWKEKLPNYMRPFTQWDDNLPMKRSEAMEHYLNITDNFVYYLYQKTGLSFDSADYYSDTIYQYYMNVVSKKKRPENIFCLDRETVDNNSVLKNYRWLQSDIEYLVQINAFYHYAAYLKTCGNITEEKQLEFQEQMKETYWRYYSGSKDDGPEMLLFNKFPLWEVKE